MRVTRDIHSVCVDEPRYLLHHPLARTSWVLREPPVAWLRLSGGENVGRYASLRWINNTTRHVLLAAGAQANTPLPSVGHEGHEVCRRRGIGNTHVVFASVFDDVVQFLGWDRVGFVLGELARAKEEVDGVDGEHLLVGSLPYVASAPELRETQHDVRDCVDRRLEATLDRRSWPGVAMGSRG